MNYTHKELRPFTHLLVEARNRNNRDLWPILDEEFTSLEFVECFRSVGIQYGAILPMRVKTKPCIGILKRKSLEDRQIIGMEEEDPLLEN